MECWSEVVQMSRDSHRQTGVLEEMWAGDEAVGAVSVCMVMKALERFIQSRRGSLYRILALLMLSQGYGKKNL